MYDCRKRKLVGGLKGVERTLGIHRDTEGVNGLQAMRLWAAYQSAAMKKPWTFCSVIIRKTASTSKSRRLQNRYSGAPNRPGVLAMKISQMLTAGRPLFSFEFFPPKDEAAAAALMATIEQLQQLKPDFVSVTYGAGGSTRGKTFELVARIKHEIGIEAMAHLTCVGHSKNEIRSVLKELADHGIENILALRGDPPKGQTTFKPHPDGFHYANELAEEVPSTGKFCFGIAGYPEKAPRSPHDGRRPPASQDQSGYRSFFHHHPAFFSQRTLL